MITVGVGRGTDGSIDRSHVVPRAPVTTYTDGLVVAYYAWRAAAYAGPASNVLLAVASAGERFKILLTTGWRLVAPSRVRFVDVKRSQGTNVASEVLLGELSDMFVRAVEGNREVWYSKPAVSVNGDGLASRSYAPAVGAARYQYLQFDAVDVTGTGILSPELYLERVKGGVVMAATSVLTVVTVGDVAYEMRLAGTRDEVEASSAVGKTVETLMGGAASYLDAQFATAPLDLRRVALLQIVQWLYDRDAGIGFVHDAYAASGLRSALEPYRVTGSVPL